jgi:hypothetical protein
VSPASFQVASLRLAGRGEGEGQKQQASSETALTLREKVAEIGNQLIRCPIGCSDINCSQKKGIIPRGLRFEEDSRKGNGLIIVGLNPGQAKPDEREAYADLYKRGEFTYDRVQEAQKRVKEARGKGSNYSTRLRDFANQLGWSGPILWTNLVKCESKNKKRPLLEQTKRVCVRTYLTKELDLAPNEWPVIAAGREAFKALIYLCPNRVVIGIPHPTGSRGSSSFWKLFIKNKTALSKKCRIRIKQALAGSDAKAVWLLEKA